MISVNVFVPCDAVTVRVRVDFGRSLSPIEQHVLRAVHAAHHSMEALAGLLGLTDRLVLDVVFDLWRAGHLMIDFGTARIELSRATEALLGVDGNGDLSRLPGARTEDERREVLLDQLTGRVMPAYLGLRRATDPRFTVPVDDGGFDPGSMRPQELLRALNKELEHSPHIPAEYRLPKRAVTAHVPPAQLRGGVNRRWLPVELQLGVDEATDRLRVTVLDRTLGVPEREMLADRIAEIVENDPNSEFSRALRANIDWEYDDPPQFTASIEALQRAVLKDPPPAGTRTQRHTQFKADARQAYELLKAHVAREVEVAAITDPADHRRLVRTMIAEAQRQVVLIAPMVDYEGLRALERDLETALGRGVRVLLMWGRRPEDELDIRVANALRDLRGEGAVASPLAWATRPARTNACFVVGDDQRVALGSYNVLARPDPRMPTHAGLVLSAPNGVHGCAPIIDLLQWARRSMPDYVLGSSVRIDFEPITTAKEAAPDAAEDPDDAVFMPELPSPPPETLDGVAGALTAWSDVWASVVAQLSQQMAARRRPTATVTVDGAHRAHLWRAARGAQRRLVISDEMLDPIVIGRRFLTVLENRLEQGTRVTLVYKHVRKGDTDAPLALEALAKEYPDRLQLLTTEHNRVRAIVADNEVVLGSFGFLSTGEEQARGRWHRRRSDIGLRITDAMLADTVAEQLGAEAASKHPIAIAPTVPEVLVPGIEAAVDLAMATAAQKLLVEVSAAEGVARTAELVVSALAEQADPWRLLDYLEDKAPARVVRVAAASCLRRPDADRDRTNRWLRWLVTERWTAGAYLEAAMLRHGLLDDEFPPRLPLTRIAALRGRPGFGAEFQDTAALCAPAGLERLTVTAVGFAELLCGRDSGDQHLVLSGLEVLDADSPWAPVRAELAKLLDQEPSFPAVEVRESVAQFRRDESLVDDWNLLARRFGRAAQVHFRFEAGTKTSVELFRPDGAFGQLKDVVARRELAGLREFLQQPALGDLDRAIDDATKAAGLPTRLLQGRQRHNYLLRLREVVDAARQVAGARVAPAEHSVSPRANAVAKALVEKWDAITRQHETVDEDAPEYCLLTEAIEDVKFVVEWGQHG